MALGLHEIRREELPGSYMAEESLLARVHSLSDLELAALLSLISREHCMISTPEEALDDLVEELQLVCPDSPNLVIYNLALTRA